MQIFQIHGFSGAKEEAEFLGFLANKGQGWKEGLGVFIFGQKRNVSSAAAHFHYGFVKNFSSGNSSSLGTFSSFPSRIFRTRLERDPGGNAESTFVGFPRVDNVQTPDT